MIIRRKTLSCVTKYLRPRKVCKFRCMETGMIQSMKYEGVGEIIPKQYGNENSPTHLNFHLPCLSPKISSGPTPYSMHPSIRTNLSFHAKVSSWIILREPRTTYQGSRRVALASVRAAGVGNHPCWAVNEMTNAVMMLFLASTSLVTLASWSPWLPRCWSNHRHSPMAVSSHVPSKRYPGRLISWLAIFAFA